MEQCGGSLRKRVAMSVDRISELPEALLIQILSSLPTKLVISTSVLSQRWRSVWEMMPNLEFDQSNGNIKGFAENVSKSLLLHKAPILQSLHLKVRDRCEHVYVGIWVAIAFNRHVRDFELDLNFYGNPVRFPSCLFCFNELETLKLKNKLLLDVPCLVPMKSLRTLHLDYVEYKDDESYRNLLSSCPNLEHLVLRRHYHYNAVSNFVIVAPSLKTLWLHDTIHRAGNSSFEINAPSLEFLNIEKLTGYQVFRIENALEIVEANIRNVSYIANEMIMGSLSSAKRLSLDLSPLQITFPTGVIFRQLVELEMYTHKDEWWNLLTLMLDSSPKLQVLKLIDDGSTSLDFDKKSTDEGKWNEPKYVPECLLSHLETLVWTRYHWEREEEKEVATYILRNARQLKKATFTTYPIKSKKLNKLARRREQFSELECVVSSCELVLQVE
ncbi:hypothetical protein AALP_AA8G448900 [Arabis alpina]|uniref:F-box domain-containing protein n=1 Tax=Arabis alpina TaxID=50452 RepID=A0A087GDH6_ARAAL|nr:hypothetical protein AALP_AA8G448900 [Arabis alpina]